MSFADRNPALLLCDPVQFMAYSQPSASLIYQSAMVVMHLQ